MVEPILYAALGALAATLLWLLFLPLFWARAVRLTRKQLVGRLPVSASEIIAGQDRLRAEHAISVRVVERRAENATLIAARERIAAGKAHAADLARLSDISELRAQIARLEASGGLMRYEMLKTAASVPAPAVSLKAKKQKPLTDDQAARVASGELEAARMDAEAARHATDQARIEAATRDVEIATLRAELAMLRAGAFKPATPKAVHPTDAAQPAEAEALASLRTRLDEVADAIVRASEPPDPMRAAAGEKRVRLVSTQQQEHAGA